MLRETHNALYESGTMMNENNKQSQALYNVVKVQPNTHLIHFITIESATKEMLLYVMYNIINTGSYGARESRTGHNIRNEIVGVITSLSNSNLSCGEFISEFGNEFIDCGYSKENILGTIKKYVNKYKRADWRIYYLNNSDFVESATFKTVSWLNEVLKVANDKEETSSQILAESLQIMRLQGLHTVVKHDLDGKTVEISQTVGGGKGKVVWVQYNGGVTVDINGSRKMFKKSDLKVIETEKGNIKKSKSSEITVNIDDKNQNLEKYI
jgi:hypothetical protein